MKKIKNVFTTLLLATLISCASLSQNNDDPEALGLPGDNLNLYAVLDIFQKSPTLEEFEKSINQKDNKINNLDLNHDQLVDYINVVHSQEGNFHSIILRVALTEKENQDVAVIEVNKDAAGNVDVQIIGDKDLYGKNYIVEPTNKKNIEGTPNPGYVDVGVSVYYANDWPVIVHIFSPGYVLYRSPWYWGYYPSYWYPWAPILYIDYWGYHRHHHSDYYYDRVRYIRHREHYSSYDRTRHSSTIVRDHRRRGDYDRTYGGREYKKPDRPSREPSVAPSQPRRSRDENRTVQPGRRQPPSGQPQMRQRDRSPKPSTKPSTPSTPAKRKRGG
jgi:hypothetical protein